MNRLMTKILPPFKNLGVLKRRITTQGMRTTLIWAYARGLPTFTGVPILQFSEVTPHLYVGAQFNKRGKALLEKQGFTGCINLRIEKDDAAFGLDLPNYLYLPTIDDTAPPSSTSSRAWNLSARSSPRAARSTSTAAQVSGARRPWRLPICSPRGIPWMKP